MANNKGTPTRDEHQSQYRQQTGQPTTSTGETRSAESTPGAERERSIRTTRDGATGRGASTTRSSSIAPVYGAPAAASPFGLMRRMAEDMDRIFEDFGFAGPGFALSPLLSPSFDRTCEATFKDGVLEVTLPMPRQPERQARKIAIR
ncbi:MAG TPA: hypothetical protein VFS59_18420 [Gemmatimonadaceae bacterium]|nr:hypothetical protein [Gemmatimonadaceae bacterium]